MKISLVMIVKNEEKNIENCILSIRSIIDEVIVVDTGSKDNTINIIKNIENVKLFHFKWCNDFSKARNYGIEKSSGDYILTLDSDEFLVEGTKKDLNKVMKNNQIGRILIESLYIKDKSEYLSKEYVSRFFPRDIRYIGSIHEQLNTTKERVNMKLKVKHSGYYNKDKSSRNIPLLEKEIKNNPADSYYLFQLGKELRISKQYLRSFNTLMEAYKLPIEESFYAQLVIELINSGKECGKEEVIEIIFNNEEKLINISDFHFNKGLFYLDYCLKYPEKAVKFLKEIEKSFLDCLVDNKDKQIEFVKGTSSYLAMYNLGVYYEVIGELKKANNYYELSAMFGYTPAEIRLAAIQN